MTKAQVQLLVQKYKYERNIPALRELGEKYDFIFYTTKDLIGKLERDKAKYENVLRELEGLEDAPESGD